MKTFLPKNNCKVMMFEWIPMTDDDWEWLNNPKDENKK
jgi:hypothetical protein